MNILFQMKNALPTRGDDGQKRFTAIASSDDMDRDDEVLLPRGIMTEDFLKNPIMLEIHENRKVPVGKVHELTVDEKGEKVNFEFSFADTDEGRKFEKLYTTGFMNAFSVGFIPRAVYQVRQPRWMLDDPEKPEEVPKSVELKLPDGSTQKVNLEKYGPRLRNVVHAWELLEISPVPIPSNPHALIQRATDSIKRKFVSVHGKASAPLYQSRLDKEIADVTAHIDQLWALVTGEKDIDALSPVLPFEAAGSKVDDGVFDSDAETDLAALASDDGSGEKDTIDWALYSRAFAYVELKHANKFTGYRFGHHVVRDGALVLGAKALYDAMADVLGAQCGLNDAERAAVYEHLAAHYREFNLHLPEFKTDYDEHQLDRIKAGKVVFETEGEGEGDETVVTLETVDRDVVTAAALDALGERMLAAIAELEQSMRVRLNIMGQKQKEICDALTRRNVDADDADDDDGGGDAGDATMLDANQALRTMITQLNELSETNV